MPSKRPPKFIESIHQKAKTTSEKYKRCEIDLIEVLQAVDQYKVFRAYNYSSLFKYATGELALSSDVAYIFINVARKSTEVPALKEEIKKGAITVSKAKRITSVLTPENQDHWIELAKTESKEKLEKHIAMECPKLSVKEKLSYVHPTKEIRDHAKVVSKNHNHGPRVQLQVGVSEKLMIDLRRVQDLVSQKRKRNVSLEDSLEAMVSLYLQRNDPVKKAQRQLMKGKLGSSRLTAELGPGPVTDKAPSLTPGQTSAQPQPQTQVLVQTPTAGSIQFADPVQNLNPVQAPTVGSLFRTQAFVSLRVASVSIISDQCGKRIIQRQTALYH